MISIIVPVYNAEEFITTTIENLLAQNVDKEIILVNDGSTDGSLQILKEFEGLYDCVRVIDKPNGGVSSARNKGIEAAKGDFLMFVDSDDLLEDGTLQQVQQNFSDEIDIVFYSYKHVAADGHVISAISYMPTGKYSVQEWTADTLRFIYTFIVGCIGTFVCRTSIIRENNISFNERIDHYEDIAFGYEILSHIKTLYYINEPYYWYMHINPSSLFGGYNHRQPLAMEFCLDKLTAVLSPQKCVSYVRELFFDCIRNEAVYDVVSYQDKCRNLLALCNSSYISCLRGTVKGNIYYDLLRNKCFHLLLFVDGFMPKTKAKLLSAIVLVGRFVKYKIRRHG
ncbi:MAG: glycosyltransferase [Prevotellaceae bacterium]|nr:glycosyltransferase [Prevotellaceae bacterium]